MPVITDFKIYNSYLPKYAVVSTVRRRNIKFMEFDLCSVGSVIDSLFRGLVRFFRSMLLTDHNNNVVSVFYLNLIHFIWNPTTIKHACSETCSILLVLHMRMGRSLINNNFCTKNHSYTRRYSFIKFSGVRHRHRVTSTFVTKSILSTK